MISELRDYYYFLRGKGIRVGGYGWFYVKDEPEPVDFQHGNISGFWQWGDNLHGVDYYVYQADQSETCTDGVIFANNYEEDTLCVVGESVHDYLCGVYRVGRRHFTWHDLVVDGDAHRDMIEVIEGRLWNTDGEDNEDCLELMRLMEERFSLEPWEDAVGHMDEMQQKYRVLLEELATELVSPRFDYRDGSWVGG